MLQIWRTLFTHLAKVMAQKMSRVNPAYTQNCSRWLWKTPRKEHGKLHKWKLLKKVKIANLVKLVSFMTWEISPFATMYSNYQKLSASESFVNWNIKLLCGARKKTWWFLAFLTTIHFYRQVRLRQFQHGILRSNKYLGINDLHCLSIARN